MPKQPIRSGLACLALLVPVPAGLLHAAAERSVPELITDRPDQTESAYVVPPGYVQLETGWAHIDFAESERTRRLDSFPATLLRIGLARPVELRIVAAGYLWLDGSASAGDPSGGSANGWGDAGLGVKVVLARERGARPQTAFLADTRVPVGDDPFTTGEFDPAFRFAFSSTLSERLSLGYNIGAEWQTRVELSEATLSVLRWTVALGISAAPRLGVFVELFGGVGLSSDERSAASFDSGLTYRVRENLQLDLSAGVGLSGLAPDWLAGVGLSYRFPR